MNITIINHDKGFLLLEKEWNDLTERAHSSFYSGFDYTKLTWKYSRSKNDRLLIILVKKYDNIIGIAPLKISIKTRFNIKLRTIEFINEWQSDKPRVITLENERLIWDKIYRFLDTEFTKWDVISLVEQTPDNKPLQKFIIKSRYDTERLPDATSYYVALDMTWEDYLSSRKRKVRSNYNNRLRKLHALPGKCLFDHISQPIDREHALARFIMLEKKSWKKSDNIGISMDTTHEKFYVDLLVNLGGNNVSFHFLTIDSKDIAGLLLFKGTHFLYESHIVYDQEYSKYSPGILLRGEVLKAFFGSPYLKYDMLGMRAIFPSHKIDWATGEEKTNHVLIRKMASRAFPIVLYKKIKKIFTSFYC